MPPTPKPALNPALLAVALYCCLALAQAPELQPIALPPPQTSGGKPLMQTLKERQTWREFNSEKLPPQTLANLLWAAFGVNRPESGHRTAPSAMNSQEIDLYVATSYGLYLYEPRENRLRPLLAGDLRDKTGGQPFVKEAPLALIFVADLARLAKAKPEERERYALIDTGYISQNVYLFCASEGLATVAHELDRAALAQTMKLGPEQKVILAQSVGFPKRKT